MLFLSNRAEEKRCLDKRSTDTLFTRYTYRVFYRVLAAKIQKIAVSVGDTKGKVPSITCIYDLI